MRPLFIRIFLLFLLVIQLAVPLHTRAEVYTVTVHSLDSNDADTRKLVNVPASFITQAEAYDFIQQMVPKLQERGFLAASIDSLTAGDTKYDVYLYAGRSYKWGKISFENIPQALQLSAAIDPGQWQGYTLSPKQIANVSEKMLVWCEANGYPFARIWLEDVQLEAHDGVTAKFMLDKGSLRKIDSIQIAGDVHISPNYLMRYLDIRKGDLYNEKKLANISARLKELSFLQESKPWDVIFRVSDTRLNLHLAERKANQLNAIIGLLPNSAETGKFLLTVDALFAFQNVFGAGESMSVTYQNLQYKSPNLKADLAWPYLFNTQFGLDGHFEFYRKDTAYRRTLLQLGVRYQLTATDYVRAFYQNQSTRLITIDTAYVLANHQLPENADVAANGAGVELVLDRTDYRISPRKGLQVRFSTSALLRSVRKNDAITGLQDGTGFDFSTLYDSLKQQAYQYHFTGDVAYYIQLGRKATLKTAYDGAWISGERLFRNELYQIGGFKLLRGFDEQSIYASQYHIVTVEMRLLLSQNSYVYLFSDNAYVVSAFNGTSSSGMYNGFGIGTTLETKSGLFTISYALGRSGVNPLQLRQSKIHFGYVAYF